VTAANNIEKRLEAIEEVVFADDSNIADALMGLLAIVQHLSFIVGDTFHDLSDSFQKGMEHIGQLLERAETGDAEETADGPHLTVIPGDAD
jgi:predicted secreted acid phosphatase